VALLPTRQRDQVFFIIAVLALGLGFVYYMYAFSPKQQQLAQIETHLEALQAQNAKAKAELAKGSVDELRAQALRYQQNLALMRQLVPSSNEVPALLEQVSTAARRVGLDLASVDPDPVIPGQQFDTYRYKIAVVGDYHSLAEFLTNVGSLTRIIAPINLTLSPPSTSSSARKKKGRDQSILEARFQIQTYVAKAGAPRPGAKS
jgi:type IV pilus assembly protein PilO